jgi:hypothetical protein
MLVGMATKLRRYPETIEGENKIILIPNSLKTSIEVLCTTPVAPAAFSEPTTSDMY